MNFLRKNKEEIMYPIVRREKLADKIYLMDVKAPRVAQYCDSLLL